MEVEVLLEKIFFTSKQIIFLEEFIIFKCILGQEFIDNNEISECFEMKFPVMIEKKYNLKKGMLYYYGKYLFTENGQKIMEIKCAANSNTIFYGNYVIAGYLDIFIKFYTKLHRIIR